MREWLLWNLQGRPTRFPTVLRPGWLIIVSDGSQHLVNWTFGMGRMDKRHLSEFVLNTQYGNDLWEHLALNHKERVVWLTLDQWNLMRSGSRS